MTALPATFSAPRELQKLRQLRENGRLPEHHENHENHENRVIGFRDTRPRAELAADPVGRHAAATRPDLGRTTQSLCDDIVRSVFAAGLELACLADRAVGSGDRPVVGALAQHLDNVVRDVRLMVSGVAGSGAAAVPDPVHLPSDQDVLAMSALLVRLAL